MDIANFLSNALYSVYLELYKDSYIFAIFLIIERFLPAEKQSIGSITFNIKWAIVYNVMGAIAIGPIITIIAYHGIGLISIDLTSSWLAFVSPLMAIFIADGFYYWFHRAQHTIPALWAQHKLHHSDETLNVTTTERQHWTESLLQNFTIYIPIAILFDIKKPETMILAPFIGYWVYFIHANVRLHLGPLATIISGPQGHRIHHSRLPQHHDRNFAAFFPIWDVLFGTFHYPKAGEYPPTGLASGEKVNSLTQAFFLPFKSIFNLNPTR